VPRELLTEDTLLTQGKQGRTVLHYVAATGTLDKIPAQVLKGRNGKAVRRGFVERLVGALHNQPVDNYCHGVQKPAYYLQHIAANMLIPDTNGITPLHLAAENGHLDQVPSELLTETNLKQYAKGGITVMHHAMKCKCKLPEQLLVPKLFLSKNVRGMTPLDVAVEHGHLDNIPLEMEEVLLQPDEEGKTALHKAALAGILNQLPKPLLTAQNLLLTDNNGISPLEYAVRSSAPSLMAAIDIDQNEALAPILGTELPETARAIVGEDWWEQNEKIRKSLDQQVVTSEPTEVELF